MRNENYNWKCDLPIGKTLHVFSADGTLIFESSGKWLMPLFEFENFLENYEGEHDNFFVHDTAIGKAAVVLMKRTGVRHIHADLVSELARDYIADINGMELVYDKIVPKLLCATEDELSRMTDENEMYRILRRRAKLVRGTEISVEHLSCHYSKLRNFSFTLKAGENLLIVGENGAGKTTLLRYLTGNLLPDEGTILIDGKSPRGVQSSSICYVPQQQDASVFPLSVEEVVSLGIPHTEKNQKAVIVSALERVGCSHLLGRSFPSLSGGEKQKVSIARALAQNAKLLLLDEPTSQLDENARNMVIEILKSISVKEIPSVIIVTHDMELVEKLGWKTLRIEI